MPSDIPDPNETERRKKISDEEHALRSPLTSLRMSILMLANQSAGPLNERQAELIGMAKEDVERMLQRLDQLKAQREADSGDN